MEDIKVPESKLAPCWSHEETFHCPTDPGWDIFRSSGGTRGCRCIWGGRWGGMQPRGWCIFRWRRRGNPSSWQRDPFVKEQQSCILIKFRHQAGKNIRTKHHQDDSRTNKVFSCPCPGQLLKQKMTMVGTVGKNKPELPPELLTTRGRAVFSSKLASLPPPLLFLIFQNWTRTWLCWAHCTRQLKSVMVRTGSQPSSSTMTAIKEAWTTWTRLLDRTAAEGWLVILGHPWSSSITSYNAFVIWQEINPTWMSGKKNKGRSFLEQLGKALVAPCIERRELLPPPQKPLQPLWKLFRELDLVLIHLRLQLGQSQEKGASSVLEEGLQDQSWETHLQSPFSDSLILSCLCWRELMLEIVHKVKKRFVVLLLWGKYFYNSLPKKYKRINCWQKRSSFTVSLTFQYN